MKVTFTHKKPIAEHIFSFHFEPQQHVHYTAGQFIELHLPHKGPDNRGTKRWFTLSSSPHEDHLAITTNFSPGEGSTFKQTLLSLKPGTAVDMASPMGDFVLPKDPSIPLLFVAGGIGCTPFRSIIKDLELTKEKRNIKLIYAAQKPEKIAFEELFQSYLGENFLTVFTQPPADWKGARGHLTAGMIREIGQPTDDHYIYLSGPEPMVETLNDDLKTSGFSKRHLYTDFFPGYLPI